MVAGTEASSNYVEFENASGVEFRGKRNDSSVGDNNLIVSMRGFSNEVAPTMMLVGFKYKEMEIIVLRVNQPL